MTTGALVLLGTVLVAVIIFGAGELLQPLPPTATPTPLLETALAQIATATATEEPLLVVPLGQAQASTTPRPKNQSPSGPSATVNERPSGSVADHPAPEG